MRSQQKQFAHRTDGSLNAPLQCYAGQKHLELVALSCNEKQWLCDANLPPEAISLVASLSSHAVFSAQHMPQRLLYEQPALLAIERELKTLLAFAPECFVASDGQLHRQGKTSQPWCSGFIGPDNICVSLFSDNFIALIYPDDTQYISRIT